MPARRPDPADIEAALQRELYFFTLYRVLEAALLALMVYSPVGALIGEPRHPLLAHAATVGYLLAGLALLGYARRSTELQWQVALGTAIDVVVAILATHAMPAASTGIAMMLLFNIGAAALLLPLRYGLGAAAIASAALLGEHLWTTLRDGGGERPLAELVMFMVSYLSIATLTHLLGRQMRASHALAERRGVQVANLAEVNELIIRRMRTGVLLVEDDTVQMVNEAAMPLLGDNQRSFSLAMPEVSRRMDRWQENGHIDETPLRLGPDQLEYLPRFARLLAESGAVLVFLDDASMVSRRAESLTLATLGRFSASLAHEIRNPLAAISYATQLLEESDELAETDRRMLQIVHQQCLRMNGIIESVLGLARRERAQAEHIELVGFVRRFIRDYRATMASSADSLEAGGSQSAVSAVFDPRHLQQVLTVLVHNALLYGRLPGEPARVQVLVQRQGNNPTLEVRDRGPGMPEPVAAQLFRPFFTTSEHGTGLGLYIARELCRANQATLEHVPVPGGGACFRVTLPGPHALLRA